MNDRMHTVYRLFNADGELLYVGCSLRAFKRLYDHAGTQRSQQWWQQAVSCTFEHFTDRETALERERQIILTETPRFNVRVDGPKLIATGKRKERAAKVKELQDQGLKLREIGEIMGIAVSTVHSYLSDPDGSKDKARKASYGGSCEVCGDPTDGSNGAAKAPKRCHRHTERPGGKWADEQIIRAIKDWAVQHGGPPAAPDWDPYSARKQMNDEVRATYFEAAAGRWPHFQTVIKHFGSWNAAIEAAGFTPRAAHGGDGNSLRRRDFQEAA